MHSVSYSDPDTNTTPQNKTYSAHLCNVFMVLFTDKHLGWDVGFILLCKRLRNG